MEGFPAWLMPRLESLARSKNLGQKSWCIEFGYSEDRVMKVRPKTATGVLVALLVAALMIPGCHTSGRSAGGAAGGVVDPGVRGGAPGGGGPLSNLTSDESAFFQDGSRRFAQIEVVSGGSNNGLGPRFNSIQCLSCHSHPAPGGTSPAQNPLIAIATLNGAKDIVPWFITANGPIREARFKKNPNDTNDGEVHNLFVITGRADAPGCNIAQPDFLPAGNPLGGQGGNPNISSASRRRFSARG